MSNPSVVQTVQSDIDRVPPPTYVFFRETEGRWKSTLETFMRQQPLFENWSASGGRHSVVEATFTFFPPKGSTEPTEDLTVNEFLIKHFLKRGEVFGWSLQGTLHRVRLNGGDRGVFPSLGHVFLEFFQPKGWRMSHPWAVDLSSGERFYDYPGSYHWCVEGPTPETSPAPEVTPPPATELAKDLGDLDSAVKELQLSVSRVVQKLTDPSRDPPKPRGLTKAQELLFYTLAQRVEGDEVSRKMLENLRLTFFY